MDIIKILEKRNLIDQLTSKNLNEILQKPTSLYLGFDPTADSLHLGHLVGVILLLWLKKAGHKCYALIGGATGRIGDPSGKSIERPFLNDEIISKNVSSLKSFLEKILGEDMIVVNNNDWFKNINFIDFLRDAGKYFRIGSMLGKESVRLRMESKEGMSFTEFSYQLVQAYDYYYLNKKYDISLQVGGSDQWGNITAGIDLIRKINSKTVYGFTFPLLTSSDGKKFGKSEKGAIWLSSDRLSYYDFYQYLFRIADSDVIKLLKMLTFLDIKEIEDIEKQMQSPNYIPNSAQKILAKEVTRLIHGQAGLDIALKATSGVSFKADETLDFKTLEKIATDIPNVSCLLSEILDKKYVDICPLIGLTTSKSEATRLIKNNGAYLNNKKIEDLGFVINEKDIINNTFLLFGSGKKKKILVKIKKNNFF